MPHGSASHARPNSLMSEYAALLGDAVLRYRAREAQHAARIETDLANRVKSEFIANMSHELRTPLNTVMGFSKLLADHEKRTLSAREVVEYATLIHGAASHLLAVFNDILDISKIQSGRYTINAQEVAVDEIVMASICAQRQAALDAGLTLEQHIKPDVPMVRGDRGKLQQVFCNLLSNAIKFTPRGGRVMMYLVAMPDGGVAALIEDTGVGMSAEEISVALTPFGQVDGSRSRWREGTGLGLPIARALVELHGGTIRIRSQKGSGTEVAVVLPPRHQVSLAHGREAIFS